MSKILIDEATVNLALEALKSMANTLAEHQEPTTFYEDEAMSALKALAVQSGWQKIECPICGDMAIATDIPATQLVAVKQKVGIIGHIGNGPAAMEAAFASALAAAPQAPVQQEPVAGLSETQAKAILVLALDLEKTGRAVAIAEGQERTDFVARNRNIQCALEDALRNATTPQAQPAPVQKRRKVGDSRFESWFSEGFDPKNKGTKQQMREAYEAGLNDPQAQPAQKHPQNCGTGYCSCIECVIEPAKQEPVGIVKDLFTNAAWDKLDVAGSTKVYLDSPQAQPAQRKPLTLDQTGSIIDACEKNVKGEFLVEFARAIESKVKENT